jgi:hypothetical protein
MCSFSAPALPPRLIKHIIRAVVVPMSNSEYNNESNDKNTRRKHSNMDYITARRENISNKKRTQQQQEASDNARRNTRPIRAESTSAGSMPPSLVRRLQDRQSLWIDCFNVSRYQMRAIFWHLSSIEIHSLPFLLRRVRKAVSHTIVPVFQTPAILILNPHVHPTSNKTHPSRINNLDVVQ